MREPILRRLLDAPVTVIEAHQSLPRVLRVQWLVPATFVFIVVTGLAFALPPGPLCDEGMVLFMEGGCDMGDSNIFFFSKLGILTAITVALIVAWRRQTEGVAPFLPHFLVASVLAWANRSGGHCDTYYSHPNGSIGQMVVESAAFAAVGIAIVTRWGGRPAPSSVAAVALWHAFYVASFYVWLRAFPHWTWSHTWAVSLTMLALAGILHIAGQGNRFRQSPVASLECETARAGRTA